MKAKDELRNEYLSNTRKVARATIGCIARDQHIIEPLCGHLNKRTCVSLVVVDKPFRSQQFDDLFFCLLN